MAAPPTVLSPTLVLYYKFDDDEKNLELARDMFCFMAFTSLRYSDLEKLKKANVFDDHIEVLFSPLSRQHQDR